MELKEKITELQASLSAYNKLGTDIPVVRIHFALSIAHLVIDLNKDLAAYLDDLDRRQCKEVIGLELKNLIMKDKWLKGHRVVSDMKNCSEQSLASYGLKLEFDDMPIMTTLDIINIIESGIDKMVALLKACRKRLKDAPRGLYANFFNYQLGNYDKELAIVDYEEWEMKTGKLTFGNLKTKHTMVVADFLNKKVLRRAQPPVTEELKAVQLEKVKYYLPKNYKIIEDFEHYCAIFRRFAMWEGEVLVLDYDVLGKYLFQYYYDLLPEERNAMFELVVTLDLVHQSMAKRRPIVAEQLKSISVSSLEDTRYFAVANHIKKVMLSVEMAPYIADERFTNEYLCKMIDKLMLSEHGDMIVEEWRNVKKQTTLIGNIIGCIKHAGVIKGSDLGVAKAIYKIAIIDKNKNCSNFNSYMGRGRKREFYQWVCDYVKLDQTV